MRSCSLCIRCDTKVGKVEFYSLFALFYLSFTLMLSPCLIPLDRGKDCLFINISWQEWILKIHTQLDSFDRFRAINYVHLKAHNYCSQLWVFHQKFPYTWTVGYTTNFAFWGPIGSLLFKISCITTSSFSTVQAGCVEAGKIIEEDYNHSPGISTRITEGMSYSMCRLSHGMITYLLGFWQLC